MNKKIALKKAILCLALLNYIVGYAQTTPFPEPGLDGSLVPPSPNAQSYQSYGNTPVALFEGQPQITIPVYQVRCGSLLLPINLSYNYNGLFPLQDAGWTGLGWNLNAGGVITRTVQGYPDSSQGGSVNYGQYNIHDSLFANPVGNNNFLSVAYNNNLEHQGASYDMALDIFDAEFNGHSAKFYLTNGRAYLLNYDKEVFISGSAYNGNLKIITGDGTTYSFTAKETTTVKHYGGTHFYASVYGSAWFLTSVISADTKDTITLNYASYTYQQAQVSYQGAFAASMGSYNNLGADPIDYTVTPSVQTQILQSIVCRTTQVNFTADGSLRTDVLGTYPRLKEIDVVDRITNTTIKKNTFLYEYFGQTSTNPAAYERLKLKKFNAVNVQNTADSLTYTFKYLDEYLSFPIKGTLGVDYWGYYNGENSNVRLIPSPDNSTYNPSIPPTTWNNIQAGFSLAVRQPYYQFAKMGTLDTIVYPSGGYTAFEYEANDYLLVNNNIAGPGIRLKSMTNYDPNLQSITSKKIYSYKLDDGSKSSGILTNFPNYTFPQYNGSGSDFYVMVAPQNGAGTGGYNPLFYYKKVTEQSIGNNNEVQRSDHYFTSYPGIFLTVRQTSGVDYVHNANTDAFTPVAKSISEFSATTDTSLLFAVPYITAANTVSGNTVYTYGFNSTDVNTSWVRPTSIKNVQYTNQGDSLIDSVKYIYSSARNVIQTNQVSSDGQTLIQKFKYPEDYTTALTGSMVSSRVVSPIIEKEIWIKKDATDSLMISGELKTYDQTTFKPLFVYGLETTSPLTALNSEAKSGSLYNSLVSDTRYKQREQVLYTTDDNISSHGKTSDLNVVYIWDYQHSLPVAEIKNANVSEVAYSSFESNGQGNWSFTGTATPDNSSPTGTKCYNLGQTSGSITKSGLVSTSFYTISYWTKNATSLIISGTQAGYPIKGKTINGWTYYEHKISGQTSITVSGTGYIDELRLYPLSAQMTSKTFIPLVGVSSECDAENRITYYQYDGFGRLQVVLDQDRNIIKTIQHHFKGETYQ
ncbi:MAG: hypothetical protein QM802_20695 [Agriterribacter sp.]